ncbi:MAG: fluoride efflux transporter CrcB [Campylobacteraceae bacterium]
MLYNCFIISIGAIIGALSRYGIFSYFESKHLNFPYHTLIVNLIGCFLIGVLYEYFSYKTNISYEMKLFLTTGILSSFTTFSSFALDNGILMQKGEFLKTFLYISSSVLLGILLFFVAIYLTKIILK